MFSSRVPTSLRPNPLSRALDAARAASRPLLDLTVSNPTNVGIIYPDAVVEALQSSDALAYRPAPLGLWTAREAIARDYLRQGISVTPERIVLTSSTSEAYSVLFKLLCEPSGDAVLTPVPSYPLFEHLTRLDGVSPVPYALEYHGRWAVDAASVDAAWTAGTRAVIAVTPNNPTGSILTAAEREALYTRCTERAAALILDEVFADYPLGEERAAPASGGILQAFDDHDAHQGTAAPACLTFRLGGLSKSVGLPQMKLGWIAIEGPDAQMAAAIERLEFICDAYLSVSAPVQIAAPAWIEHGASVRRQILDRVRGNYERLRQLGRQSPSVDVLPVEGGWSAVLRVPARAGEEEIALELLERDGVVVHPGFFFDFPSEAFLVVSLLPPPVVFDEGVRRLLARVAG